MIAVYKTLKPHDEAAIVAYGVSEEILMENAARGVREFLIEKLNTASGVKIAVDMPSGVRDGMGEKDRELFLRRTQKN